MGSIPHVVEDCMGVLQLYSDGTVYRCSDFEFKFPAVNEKSVVFKDIIFEKQRNLSLRLYKPESSSSSSPTSLPSGKLPVVFYFHGGGFCVGSRLWPNFHNTCLRLSSGLGAIVVSPDHRLAPEHKLPAAIEDAVSAVEWLRSEALLDENCDAWVREAVDFERVFVLGDSSGGNLAHHLSVRFGIGSTEIAPVRVRGYILLAPFFGGVARTKSEEGPSEAMLNLDILDRFWRLSMPAGENRDHPLANPLGPNSPSLEDVGLEPILAIVGGNEMLKDRVESYYKRLKQLGKKIEYVEFDGKEHGFFTNDPYSKVADEVVQLIKRFMLHNSN